MSASKEEQKAARAAAKEQQAQERARQKEERRSVTADKKRQMAERNLDKSRAKAEKKGINVEGAILVAHTYEDSGDEFLILFPDRVEHVRRGKAMSPLASGAGIETIPIDRISSAESYNSGIRSIVEIHTSGNSITFRSDLLQAHGMCAAILEQMKVGKAPTVPAAAPEDDIHDQLRKLAALHADGILTDDEFASKKSQLLDRM